MMKAWRTVLEQLDYVSKQHEMRAEDMAKQVKQA
jgi:hypothetical protein